MVISHNPSVYTVSKGDTLLKISWKIGMPVWTLIQSNPGIDINKLSTGQQLNVPSRDEMLPLPIVPNKRIVLSISKQRMWVYQDGKLLNKFVISTGIDRSPTQPGVFQVQTHDPNAYASVWDLTMPNFLGIYEAWPGFMNGIHGLPMLSNGRRLWGSILGHPASFGCIILTLDAAKWLYDWAENGVVVEIFSRSSRMTDFVVHHKIGTPYFRTGLMQTFSQLFAVSYFGLWGSSWIPCDTLPGPKRFSISFQRGFQAQCPLRDLVPQG